MDKFSEAIERRIKWAAYDNYLHCLSEDADLSHIEEQLSNDEVEGTNSELDDELWSIVHDYMEPWNVLELIEGLENNLRDFARFVTACNKEEGK